MNTWGRIKVEKSVVSVKYDVRERFPNSETALKYRSFTNNTLAVLVKPGWEQLPASVMTLLHAEAPDPIASSRSAAVSRLSR